MPAIEISHLTKVYRSGTKALNDVSLDIAEGDFFALLGANGAGKTTLINALIDLVTKTSGKVKIFGHDIDVAHHEAKQFIVYFPFDQYVLTPEAQSVVSEAANYATSGHATKLVVVGHTDTSGSPKYNAKLSERRAKAVADALVGAGVAADTLAVDWKGESAPAVATGDGVKEPLNRRSTISINF